MEKHVLTSKEIEEQIKNLIDLKYKQFHSKLCPGVNNILGVRVPQLRKLSKQLVEQNEIIDLLKNIKDVYYEEIMLQGMLIGQMKENIEVVEKHIQQFITKINNWAVCDTFCAGLKIVQKNKEEVWNFIQPYLKSNVEFEVRFAVVIILDYYIEEKYIEQVLHELDNIQTSAYYAQMAIAWAISVCYAKYPEITKKYLQNSNLDEFTKRKAIQKIKESYRCSNIV